MIKKFAAVTSVIVLAFSLTACDPPMPPDVAAGILEQTYTCEQGNVTAAFPENMSDPAAQLADSLATSCVDPLAEMTLEPQGPDATADLIISEYAPDQGICKPAFVVPFAIESADLVFQLTDSTTLNLTAKTAAAILNGDIKNWNDPAIAEENVETTFPDLTIKVHKTADQQALKALTGWFKYLKADITPSGIKSKVGYEFPELAEGEIAIAPHSQVLTAGAYSAAIVTGKNKETDEPLLAIPDSVGIATGASQMVATSKDSLITLELDTRVTPVLQDGQDEASIPYQAIYPINLYACGEDSLLKHAVALFLLRLDSQGTLAASNYNPLAESTRFASLEIARKGLPTPSPAAE